MFERLQKKWKVNGWRLLLILITFALGGSLTGFTGKKIMSVAGIETPWIYIPLYIIVITIIWPLTVLMVSIPLGQFAFFTSYIKKIGRRFRLTKQMEKLTVDSGQLTDRERLPGDSGQLTGEQPDKVSPTSNLKPPTPNFQNLTRIAIFASGTGTNAQKIIEYFRLSETSPEGKRIKVALIVCNKPEAGVLRIAEKEKIPSLIIEKERFFRGDGYLAVLKENQIDKIILAGFLWKFPGILIKEFPRGIINIHPALLPDFGGKGMYGALVHEAVLISKQKESGITIHYVDEHYDNGDIIFQARCPVMENDSAESLSQRVMQLEHFHYPRVIESVIG